MAFAVHDRVMETSTTTGTGNLTVAGAVTGFQTFGSRYATNDTFPYFVEGVDAAGSPTGEWESGIGTYNGSNVVARTTVIYSSNGDAAVNFSSGTKRVCVGPIAKMGGWQLLETLTTTSGTSVTSAIFPPWVSDLLFQYNGVSHSNGTSTTMTAALSSDNSTYTGTAALTASTANTATWYGQGKLLNRKLGAGTLFSSSGNLTSNNSINSNNSQAYAWRLSGGVNYARFAMAAGNFDAGSITIYGRA